MTISSVAFAAALAVVPSSALRGSVSAPYEEFRQKFGVDRSHDDAEGYYNRVALFEKRREEVAHHNAQPHVKWTKAVNKFADWNEEEFQALLGHRPIRHHVSSAAAAANSLLQLKPSFELATAVDWGLKLNRSSVATAKNQGGCGSCWAVASAGALEMRAQIELDKQGKAGQSAPEVSYEQMVDCVQNLHECGGTGGCKGATSELALEYAKAGLVKKSDYKGYQSGGDGKCYKPTAKPVLVAKDFVQLPENKVQPMLEALSEGPVVVSADASGWSAYSSGVFDGCKQDATVNHAILATGYGTDTKTGSLYWLIRNSWGADWGEKGYIRLLRHQTDGEYCGTDYKPLEGVGCKGGPATLPVCGMCGVESDSAYPEKPQLMM